jgi:tetratricopeptide (TPR) repeat protein
LYRREDQLDRAATCLNQALTAARRLDDQRRVADTLYHLGTVIWSQGRNREAETYHQEAVDISRALQLDDLVAAQALHGLGETRWIAGDFVEAYQLFHESLDLCRRLGDRGLEIENLQNLGLLLSDELAASYRQARAYVQQSLKLLDETNLPWHRMPALFILGLVTGYLGDYERGFRYVQLGLDETRRRHSPRYYAAALDFLGCLYRDLNLLDKAAAAFSEGLETSRAVGVDFWAPRLQANFAITRLRQGDQNVESLLMESLEASRRRNQGIHVAVCVQGLAELAYYQGRYEQALLHAAELAELSVFGMHENLAQAYRWRGVTLCALGQRSEAEAALLQAADLSARIEKPRLAWEIHTALEHAYTLWGELESTDLHRRQAATALIAITRKIKNPALKAGLLENNAEFHKFPPK